jgi:hypothetical protein
LALTNCAALRNIKVEACTAQRCPHIQEHRDPFGTVWCRNQRTGKYFACFPERRAIWRERSL